MTFLLIKPELFGRQPYPYPAIITVHKRAKTASQLCIAIDLDIAESAGITAGDRVSISIGRDADEGRYILAKSDDGNKIKAQGNTRLVARVACEMFPAEARGADVVSVGRGGIVLAVV